VHAGRKNPSDRHDAAARVTLHDKERGLVAPCRHLGLFNPASRYTAGTTETPSATAERTRALIRERFAKLIAREEREEPETEAAEPAERDDA